VKPPTPAGGRSRLPQYLVRFDDICPTMRWSVWEHVERLLVHWNVRPILAVVPDNQDPLLKAEPPAPDFWARVRRWQDDGWSIGLHGYQHLYCNRNSGVIGINRRSEFAGLPGSAQREKVARALSVFAQAGVTPDLWVAPGHSFDETTVQCLREAGIGTLSDGFHRLPFRDAGGTLWIPQQLWKFRRAPYGVWTVCHHINAWGSREIGAFERALEAFSDRILSLPEISRAYSTRTRDLSDIAFAGALPILMRIKRGAKQAVRPWRRAHRTT